MKLAVKCAVILSWAMSSLAWAAWAEDIYAPKYLDIRFSKTSIALITERETYLFDRKVGLGHPHIGALPNNFLPSTARQKLDSIGMSSQTANGDDVQWEQWKTAKGLVFQTTDGYCDEGAEIYHGLRYQGKEIDTELPACESISDIEVIGDQLWLGSYEQHESGFGAGSGVRVISLKSKKLIVAFSPNQKSMTGYVMPLNFDVATGKLSAVKKAAAGRANGGKMIAQSRGQLADGFVRFIRPDVTTPQDVWVLTKTALHRIINGKVTERWYLSEQFSTDGQVTLLASLKPQKSNPWAIMARHTKLIDTKLIWKQLSQSPKLERRLTYAYDDEGKYFSIDGKQLSDMVMWDYDPSSSEASQELINRLKLSKK